MKNAVVKNKCAFLIRGLKSFIDQRFSAEWLQSVDILWSCILQQPPQEEEWNCSYFIEILVHTWRHRARIFIYRYLNCDQGNALFIQGTNTVNRLIDLMETRLNFIVFFLLPVNKNHIKTLNCLNEMVDDNNNNNYYYFMTVIFLRLLITSLLQVVWSGSTNDWRQSRAPGAKALYWHSVNS